MSKKRVYSIPKGEKKTPVASKVTVGELEYNDGLDGLHVGGIAIEELAPEARARLFYEQTDEGFAEKNAGKVTTSVRVTADPFDKAIQRKRDFALNEDEPWLAPDATKALADANVPAGMRPRFLSEARLNSQGNYTGGWEVVKGKDGQPIRFKTLILAQMPETTAVRRQKHYQDKANEAVKQVHQRALGNENVRSMPVERGEQYVENAELVGA